MSRFISKRFDNLEEYVPGEQPRDQQYIKLNTNESPFEPSAGVIHAISNEAHNIMLYPDPTCGELCKALGELFSVDKNNITLGNGSDEILNFCFMAYCDKNKGMAFPNISYGFYKVFAELYNIPYCEIPLKTDFSIDVDDYCNLDKNIVIANPNAPTGLDVSIDGIRKILETNPDNIVIIDEAYVNFGGVSAIPLIKEYDNLIVVGTYSKFRSMAGARLGFAAACESLTRDLNKIRFSTNPYNINRMTLAAGLACVRENDYYVKNAEIIVQNRDYTTAALCKLGFSVLDSKTNFVFAKYNGGISGKDLYLKLKEKGILVRHFDRPEISDYLRITIGTREQMESLIDCIKTII